MSGESVESQIIKDIRREYAKTYPNVMFTLTNRIEAQEAELAALRAENARLRYALEDVSGMLTCDPLGAHERIRCALSVSKDAEQDTACPVSPRGAWLSLEQLREIEWRGPTARFVTHDERSCPGCIARETQPHKDDCWLAAKIREAEEKA